ncbi:MAG: DUF1553 domain-containing protein [Planctomycetota bacterium]|nr:DUF1553 domain-containing protein [Planctomycetota bacterium]
MLDHHPTSHFNCSHQEQYHQRTTTLLPSQSLALMNSEFVIKHTLRLGEQINDQVPDNRMACREVFKRVLNRNPDPQEMGDAMEFLGMLEKDSLTSLRGHKLAALAQTLMMSNEFLFLQ